MKLNLYRKPDANGLPCVAGDLDGAELDLHGPIDSIARLVAQQVEDAVKRLPPPAAAPAKKAKGRK